MAFIDVALEKIAPGKKLWILIGTGIFLLTLVFMVWGSLIG